MRITTVKSDIVQNSAVPPIVRHFQDALNYVYDSALSQTRSCMHPRTVKLKLRVVPIVPAIRLIVDHPPPVSVAPGKVDSAVNQCAVVQSHHDREFTVTCSTAWHSLEDVS